MKHIGKTFVVKRDEKEELIVVSLQTHVDNVKSLVQAWSDKFVIHPDQRDKLIEAAVHHDDIKRFTWVVDRYSNRAEPPERHAWRGAGLYQHNKGRDCDNYVYWLIKLHHSFKVDYIAEAIASIKEYSNVNYHNFARDLYLLITCDWSDSSMLNYIVNADQVVSPREPHPFEEFVLRKQNGAKVFWLEPNPLERTVTLSIEYARLQQAKFTDTGEFKDLLAKATWQVEHYEMRGNHGLL